MSDFLARLADRALAPQPIVQPRLQSLYEPPVVAGFNSLVEEHVEIPAEAPRPPEPIQETRFRPREEQHNSKPAIERIAREPAVRREAKSESAPQQATFGRNDSQRLPLRKKTEPVVKIESTKRESRPPIRTRKDGGAAPPAENAPPNQAPTVARQESGRAADQVHPVESKPHPQRTQQEADEEKTISHEPKPPARKPRRQPTIVTVKSLRKPSDSEFALASPMTPTRREEPLTAPSVHVMIGRVEIRAVTPPAPVLRTNSVSAAGRLSLDDYLKRNAGGGR